MEKITVGGDMPYLVLPVPQEFQYAANLSYLARSANECMFHIKDGNIYQAIKIENEEVLIEVSCENNTALHVHFCGRDRLPERTICEGTARYVREWFDLDTDIGLFYQLAERHPLLADLVRRFYGLRVIGIPNLFEALCWGIMGQQINLTYAYTLKKRFVETFGHCIDEGSCRAWIFPLPEDIAKLSVEHLTPLGLTRRKSEYVLEIAARMADGRLSKGDLLQKGDFRLAEKELTAIRGIGPWTANYVLMRCLRDPSAFPIADVGLHNAVGQLLQMDTKPTLKELDFLFADWKDWAAYITFYMWRTLY